MKKAIRDAWVQSLRSGLYPQIQGQLCRKEKGGLGFCCLGVLADVVDPAAWGAPPEDEGGTRYFSGAWMGSLPSEFKVEVGLRDYEQRALVTQNDVDKKTFPEIADWIEENIPVEDAA